MNNRSLNLTIPELMRLADIGLGNIKRDKAILLQYGITDALINELETDNRNLKEMRTDEELLSVVSEKVREKDQKAGIVREGIRAFMVRANNVFGAESPEVKGFGTARLSHQTDAELVRTGRAVKRMCISKLSQLSVRGLTPEMIDEFAAKVEEFDAVIDEVVAAEIQRREGTVARNQLALKVYNQVAEIFDYGKNYFRGKDVLKYEDYVIFDTQKTSKPVTGKNKLNSNSNEAQSTENKEGATPIL